MRQNISQHINLEDLAKKHNFMVINDFAYAKITFDGYVAPSLLEVPGAMDVGVEFGSFSKSYNMAGWRVGMAVGHQPAIKALAAVKTQIDSGIAKPIQDMAAAALTGVILRLNALGLPLAYVECLPASGP